METVYFTKQEYWPFEPSQNLIFQSRLCCCMSSFVCLVYMIVWWMYVFCLLALGCSVDIMVFKVWLFLNHPYVDILSLMLS
jgi:hypothetical protein